MFKDIYNNSIDYALQTTINKLENEDAEGNEFIVEVLKRSRAVWDNIRIHGLEIYGMTYDQFCEQCENKRNILFFSDDEMNRIGKAIRIMEVMDA